jgi:hypothetical protein
MPTTTTPPPQQPSKYELKELHRQIDLYDRKIAACESFEKFDSEVARASSRQKLVNKRERLVKSARAMESLGVEYDAAQLPRSFKNAAATAAAGKTSA